MTRLNQRPPTIFEQFDPAVDDRLSQDGVELFRRNTSREGRPVLATRHVRLTYSRSPSASRKTRKGR